MPVRTLQLRKLQPRYPDGHGIRSAPAPRALGRPGLPLGLKGEEIHIFGRITAIADAFDALLHKRVRKSAWAAELAKAHFRKHRMRQFDPYLIDILLENSTEFVTLSNKYPEPAPGWAQGSWRRHRPTALVIFCGPIPKSINVH